MVGKKFRKIYINDTKHNFWRKYLFVFISLILAFSLILLLWSNDLKIESKTASLSFGWLWHSNKSTIVEQLARDAKRGSLISIPVNGLIDNMVRIEDDFCINPHKFNYILDPKSVICNSKRKEEKPLFLVYIHSAPHHYARRMLIRETWGSQSNFDHLDVHTIFMCGAANNSNVQAALELEFDRYGDIVQEDFVDSYRNLTYKAIMALRWVSQNCRNAKLILKADDDIFINIFKLVPHLESILKQKEILREPMDRTIICNVWTQMKVIRDPNSKWYVSREEIPDDYFKTYCSGSLYAFTPGLAGSLFEISRHVPFFWVDDYYVTGMLPEKMKEAVSYESINKFYFLSAAEFMNKFGSGDGKLVVGHAHNINNWKQVWSLVIANTKGPVRHRPQFAPSKGSNTQTPLEHSSMSFVRLKS